MNDHELQIQRLQDQINFLEKRLQSVFSFYSTFDVEFSSIDSKNFFHSAAFFSDLIQKYLIKNPKKSKFQIAQLLEISNSRLYEFLKGERLLTPHLVDKIKILLEMDDFQFEQLNSLLVQDRKNKKEAKKKITHALNNSSPGHKKKTKGLSTGGLNSWLHYAIIALLSLKDRHFTKEEMQKKLNVSSQELNKAIKHLEKIGLLDSSSGESSINLIEDYFMASSLNEKDIKNDVRAMTLDHHHKVKEVYESLNLPFENNHNAAYVVCYVATDKNKIDDAQKMLETSFVNIGQFLEEGKKEDLYALSFQLIPLSKI